MNVTLWAVGLLAENQGGAPGGMGTDLFIILGVGAVLMWLILVRPAQRKERERRDSLSKIKKGDRVVVAGGIVGTVQNADEKITGLAEPAIAVRIDDKTRITVLRSSIHQIIVEPAAEPKKEQAGTTA